MTLTAGIGIELFVSGDMTSPSASTYVAFCAACAAEMNGQAVWCALRRVDVHICKAVGFFYSRKRREIWKRKRVPLIACLRDRCLAVRGSSCVVQRQSPSDVQHSPTPGVKGPSPLDKSVR